MLEVHNLSSCNPKTVTWKQQESGSGLVNKGSVKIVIIPKKDEVSGLLGKKAMAQISTTYATTEPKLNAKFIDSDNNEWVIVSKVTLYHNNPVYKNFYQFEVSIKNAK